MSRQSRSQGRESMKHSYMSSAKKKCPPRCGSQINQKNKKNDAKRKKKKSGSR
jgi:hypothetical protein